MRFRPSSNVRFEERVLHFKRKLRIDTQRLRDRWINELEELFGTATSIASGRTTQYRVGAEMRLITPKERQMWANVAANIGNVMGNLSRTYDERQIDKDLDELEQLLGALKNTRQETKVKDSSLPPANESPP